MPPERLYSQLAPRRTTRGARAARHGLRRSARRDATAATAAAEEHGAAFMTTLRILAKQARLPGATDLTQYGEGRASTKAFLTHHVANTSTAWFRRPTPTPCSAPPSRARSVCRTASPKMPWACIRKSVVALYR